MAIVKDKKAFIEAAKEFARLVLIATISAAFAGVPALLGLLDPTVAAILGVFLATLAKAWDKYLHKADNGITTGLTGF